MTTIGLYSVCGVSITKYYNALSRALLKIPYPSLTWIVGIIITLLATSK